MTLHIHAKVWSYDFYMYDMTLSTGKRSCPPRMSPVENILKCKHVCISCVRIEIILLYGELSLINA